MQLAGRKKATRKTQINGLGRMRLLSGCYLFLFSEKKELQPLYSQLLQAGRDEAGLPWGLGLIPSSPMKECLSAQEI
jgi:hypothetical protein